MQNVQFSLDGNRLVITVDLSAEGTPSKSGKTDVIASTRGNVPVPDRPDVYVGLNVYRYREPKRT